MSKSVDLMKGIHEEQLTRLTHSIVFLGFILLIFSFSRTMIPGFHKLFYFHISSYIAIIKKRNSRFLLIPVKENLLL